MERVANDTRCYQNLLNTANRQVNNLMINITNIKNNLY